MKKAEYALNQVDIAKKKCLALRLSYKKGLEEEVKTRDLSEEKMKNASILGIKLPKFKGYDSPMDFYTFKAEFEKLIVPNVQAKLMPDHLKNNFLEGQALQIVREIEDIDKIWERLKFSFGDENTLLANKLRDIEGSTPLWKLKSDEKIVQIITKIRNCMMELCSLAKKHGIETRLFHNSNLAKIYFLIGRKRQADIMKKLLDTSPTDQETWNEIIKYLDRELKVKEQILLFNKCHLGNSEGV